LGLKNVTVWGLSLVLLIDCLPKLISAEEKDVARKLGFVQALADQALEALDDPVGNETACCMLASFFFRAREEHWHAKVGKCRSKLSFDFCFEKLTRTLTFRVVSLLLKAERRQDVT
jgi:hypothetical protein